MLVLHFDRYDQGGVNFLFVIRMVQCLKKQPVICSELNIFRTDLCIEVLRCKSFLFQMVHERCCMPYMAI